MNHHFFKRLTLIFGMIVFFGTIFQVSVVSAQCSFDPIVTGDTLLCPNGTGVLTTQVYDSYQWFKHPLLGGSWQPIPGGTSQGLPINSANDAGYYFRVQATLNNCTELSPQVLVDGWVFLPPFTSIEGDYTIGTNGDLVVCQGDTVLLICGMPYDTSIQWYQAGTPISGANSDTLVVTTAGSYTFSAAPSECPSFIQFQTIPAEVLIITCPAGLEPHPGMGLSVMILPNPAFSDVVVYFPECTEIRMYDSRGTLVRNIRTEPADRSHTIQMGNLAPGYYTVCAGNGDATRCTILVRP